MLRILLLITSVFITSIYSISFQKINGNGSNNPTSFNSYQGKKILIVNIATGSPRVNQLAGLQQLYNQYIDSLVVVAFPSNTFNNEPRNNGQIKTFCQNNYSITFPIAAKGNVNGTGNQPTFNWLASGSANGLMNINIVGDFEKVLLNKNGAIIGIFAPAIQPMDTTIINAITNN